MERADYLPSQRIQELAQQVDPRVTLDREAEQVRAGAGDCGPRNPRATQR